MKTASELGISERELANLIKVRDLLDSGSIKEGGVMSDAFNTDTFNMGYSCASRNSCGTALCIGGWMKLFELDLKQDEKGLYVIGEERFVISKYVGRYRYDGSLSALFWPRDPYGYMREDVNRFTAKNAVDAINNFLRTGNPDWYSVVPPVREDE